MDRLMITPPAEKPMANADRVSEAARALWRKLSRLLKLWIRQFKNSRMM
jgi:hypothetical protein